jgi:hypothetical protein
MSLFPPAPRRSSDPAREAPMPKPIPQNPSPWARFGRWLFDRLTRR